MSQSSESDNLLYHVQEAVDDARAMVEDAGEFRIDPSVAGAEELLAHSHKLAYSSFAPLLGLDLVHLHRICMPPWPANHHFQVSLLTQYAQCAPLISLAPSDSNLSVVHSLHNSLWVWGLHACTAWNTSAVQLIFCCNFVRTQQAMIKVGAVGFQVVVSACLHTAPWCRRRAEQAAEAAAQEKAAAAASRHAASVSAAGTDMIDAIPEMPPGWKPGDPIPMPGQWDPSMAVPAPPVSGPASAGAQP